MMTRTQSSPLAFLFVVDPKFLDPAPLRRVLDRPQRLEEQVVWHLLIRAVAGSNVKPELATGSPRPADLEREMGESHSSARSSASSRTHCRAPIDRNRAS